MGLLSVLFNRIRRVPTARLLGRTSFGTGACESLTAEQVRTLLSVYSESQIDSALAAVVDTTSSLDQVFAETITWTGTTAPSGTATTRYSWTRVGKLVFFEFRFQWSVSGVVLTVAQWDFPGDFPTPATMTGQDPGEIISFVSGGGGATTLGGILNGSVAEARLQLDGSSVPQVRVRFTAGTNAGTVTASGVYRCA